jgi:CO dehydrogenase maturation factor
MKNARIVAVCGKGGVGKTVMSGVLVRVLSEEGARVLAVDADPAMGLSYFLGVPASIKTLGKVREDLISTARARRDPDEVAGATDYLLLEALRETEKFDFLAMGRSQTRGCFCPVNSLLKASIEKLAQNYDYVLVDAEAGVEQINREVMSDMDRIVVLVDGSQRSLRSMELIQQMAEDMHLKARVGVVMNRSKESDDNGLAKDMVPFKIPLWGVMREDEELRRNDAVGKSVFDLPPDSPVLQSARKAARFLA